jgi:catechol 2,3-dioxygenase-like lactoylglutathione lyase family enzyme
MQQGLTAILPCNDLDAAEAFFERLGFHREQGSLDEYRMLSDGLGAFLHLNRAVEGWLEAGRNPFGLYLYREDVDSAARAFAGETVGQPGDKAWGML